MAAGSVPETSIVPILAMLQVAIARIAGFQIPSAARNRPVPVNAQQRSQRRRQFLRKKEERNRPNRRIFQGKGSEIKEERGSICIAANVVRQSERSRIARIVEHRPASPERYRLPFPARCRLATLGWCHLRIPALPGMYRRFPSYGLCSPSIPSSPGCWFCRFFTWQLDMAHGCKARTPG